MQFHNNISSSRKNALAMESGKVTLLLLYECRVLWAYSDGELEVCIMFFFYMVIDTYHSTTNT